MFRNKEEPKEQLEVSAPQERVTSVLGPEMSWKGELTGEGGVRIEGAFEGTIKVDGMVVVDRKGRLTSSEGIQARSVIVAGTVRSDIQADRVEIRESGRLWGDVVTRAFATAEGAYMRGKIEMEKDGEEAEEDSQTEHAHQVGEEEEG